MKKFLKKLSNIAIDVYDGIGVYDETSIQTALGIEFRDNKIKFLREFNIEVFYKSFPLTLNELDFLIFPEKSLNLNEPVIIEIKVSSKINDEHRQQVRNYLKSAPLNSSEDLKKIKYGIILNFKKTEKYKDGINEKLEDTDKITIEVWEMTKDKEFKLVSLD
jgi:GxxExxY protein|tara:strand:- start:343 stop:828 length:486 start_codon:yes stop_codon:yes gene_type:complete